MSKHTTTIEEIISGALLRQGESEFINNGRLTFDNPQYAFIHKIINYDDDVSKICDDVIFKGFKLKDLTSDKKFKRTFVNRFLDRQINRQTLEAFAAQIVYVTLTHEDYLNVVFSDEVEKYLQNQNITDTSARTLQDSNTMNNSFNNSDDTTQHRQAETTLPQSQVNMNVNSDELDFADNFSIDKSKNENNQYRQSDEFSDTNTHQNTDAFVRNFNIESLKNLYDMRERVFNHYDRNCFLQIW